MDIKAKIEEIATRLLKDKTLLASFRSDPMKVVKSLLNVTLSEDILQKIVEGVKVKIGADKLSGLVGGLLGKK